ncbi:MAG: aminopeptidase N [Actinobacteria bacterium]|nr:aminopeptidase N [Actinomycetota bacterium]
MPGVNLTREEALARSAHITVDSYQVDLDLTTGAETFRAKTTVKFRSSTPGVGTFIDAVGKSMVSATLNGAALDGAAFDGESIHLNNLQAENILIVDLEAIYSVSGEGLHRFVDPADSEVYLYTQFEVADARRMYACFDQPDLKASFTLSAITPAHWEVISNNPVAQIDALPDDKKKTEFTTTPVMSTYITALVAGPYHKEFDLYKGAKEVPLGIYCRKSLAKHLDASEIFLITKQGFEYFEREFGLAYPFDKYDQLAVAEFNAGAMENAGCVTFAEDYFVFRSKVTDKNYNWRANVILHEMAHMWFGDLVTMSWWDDLWLNESFAEWASYTALADATKFKNSWTTFNAERKNWAYRQDQLSSTHPIVVDMHDLEAVRTNFDGITYAKGASVLQQLVAHVGKENFVAALKKYFAKHAWKNTTLNDLLVELEATSGRSLKPWVDTWLCTAGVNTLRPEITVDGGNYSSVVVKQEPPKMPVGSKELRPHRMSVGIYDLVGEKLLRRKSHELDVIGAATTVDAFKGEKEGDLLLINDGDLSYGKIRFDAKSVKTLISKLSGVEEPLTRALCWSATWDMLRDGELSASEYVPMAVTGLSAEKDVSVVSMTLLQLGTAVELYASDENRDKVREQVANGTEILLEQAQEGSDMQLQYARSFASFAFSDRQHSRVKDMLDGRLPGLVVDADLRWHFINCLAERGKIGSAVIDAELERDNTASGHKYAASARASIPTPEAKEKAWADAIGGELSNHIHDATIAGFNRPLQRELTKAYIDRYFDSLTTVWEKLSYELASTIVTGFYPSYQVNQLVLEKSEKWLAGAGKDAPAALRRFVSENRDALARALNAQKVDARF